MPFFYFRFSNILPINYFVLVGFHRFWVLPATLLKKMIIGRFPRKLMDSYIADSIDFMVERVRVCLISFRFMY